MPYCECFFHKKAKDEGMTDICPCAFHRGARFVRHSDSKKPLIFREDLEPGEADRPCLDMGCEQVISKLNSRFRTQLPNHGSLSQEFSLRNPFVRESLMLCMWLKLDFGTVYARFRACVLAENAGICTIGRTCTSRRLLFDNRMNSVPSTSTALRDRDRKLRVPCLLSDLDPGFDPNDGTLLPLQGLQRYQVQADSVRSKLSHTYNPITCLGSQDQPDVRSPRPRQPEYLTSEEIRRPPRRMWDLAAHRVIPTVALQPQCPRLRQECNLCQEKPSPGLGKLITEFWGISHSWVAPHGRVSVSTRINGNQWKIPIPQGVTLELVAREVKTLIASRPSRGQPWSFYCWLDLLCIRQESPEGPSELEKLRQLEWSFDIPTIGSIFGTAIGTVRYFNGLGKPFSAFGWDDERHWLNRAWTLQEIKPEMKTLNGGLTTRFCTRSSDSKHGKNVNHVIPLNTMGFIAGHHEKLRLRDVLAPLAKIATDAQKERCSIITLFQEMRRRYATTDQDKIAGINYLLCPKYLPIYKLHEGAEEAWRRSIHLLPRTSCLELIFNFPFCSRGGPAKASWAPSWAQISECPKLDKLRVVDCNDAAEFGVVNTTAEVMVQAGIIYRESCFAMDVNLWVVEQTFPSAQGTPVANHEYTVQGKYLTLPPLCNISSCESLSLAIGRPTLATANVGFFSPYKPSSLQGKRIASNVTKPIPRGRYVLVTHALQDNAGWVLCKPAAGSRRYPSGEVRITLEEFMERRASCAHVLPQDDNPVEWSNLPSGLWLKKIGVLRTDFVEEIQRMHWVRKNVACYFI